MPLINKIVWFIIIGVRPLFGPIQCRYVITCTQYAQYQLSNYSFFPALWAILKRFLSCNPFT